MSDSSLTSPPTAGDALAVGERASEGAVVDPLAHADRSDRALSRRALIFGVLGVLALTLLFSAQDSARRAVNGAPVDWRRSVETYLIDWCAWGVLAAFMAIVARRYRLDRGHCARRLIAWLLLGAILCIIQSTVDAIAMRALGLLAQGPAPRPTPVPVGAFLTMFVTGSFAPNFIIFGMITGALHAGLYYRDLRDREAHGRELEARLAHAELDVLRMQIQPHFFFNALHTVSSLMTSDVESARRVLASLGDLMRSSLEHSAHREISLRDELAFISRYLEIQQERFRSRLLVHTELDPDTMDALVPSLILQPLVENAIRHGIEPFTRRGQVWLTARREDGTLLLTVRDDGSAERAAGSETPRSPDGARRGIGLANISARLEHLYGGAQQFRAGPDNDGHFVAALVLPFHTMTGPDSADSHPA